MVAETGFNLKFGGDSKLARESIQEIINDIEKLKNKLLEVSKTPMDLNAFNEAVVKPFVKLDNLSNQLNKTLIKIGESSVVATKSLVGGIIATSASTQKLIGYQTKLLDLKKQERFYDEFHKAIIPKVPTTTAIELYNPFYKRFEEFKEYLKKNLKDIQKPIDAEFYTEVFSKDFDIPMFDRMQKSIGKLFKPRGINTIRQFRYEYLSLMFVGQALERTFGGIAKTGMEVFGFSELWSATIQTVMLPVLEPLMDILYTMFAWFMDLPEPLQKVIGGFVLFAASVGFLMNLNAQMTLLGDSLKLMSGKSWLVDIVLNAWDLIKSSVIWLGSKLLAFGADPIGVTVKLMEGAWNTLKTGILWLIGQLNSLQKIWKVTIAVGVTLVIAELARRILNYVIKNSETEVAGGATMGGTMKAYGIPGFEFFKMLVKPLNAIVGAETPEPAKEPTAFQLGGFAQTDGLYRLHAGEYVTPQNNSGLSSNITINVYGSTNPRETANEVMKILKPELERLNGTRR